MKKLKKISPFFNPRDHYLCKCGTIVVKNIECPICKLRHLRGLKLYEVPGKEGLKILKKDRIAIITHLNKLTPKEKRIMRLRYGIGKNRKPHSLEEVADRLGLTRQRVHQIQWKVLLKISR